jgi:hypothetical protein
MIQGAQVAPILAFVLKTLGGRGYRRPLTPDELIASLYLTRERKHSEVTLGRVSLALKVLEDYYKGIGSSFDARRMSDMRWVVDMVFADYQRDHEAAARCRRADMWMRAFSEAFA